MSNIHLYTLHELIDALRSVGFGCIETYLNKSREPCKLGSGRGPIVAEKAA